MYCMYFTLSEVIINVYRYILVTNTLAYFITK